MPYMNRMFAGVLHSVKEPVVMESVSIPASVDQAPKRKRARSPASITRRTRRRRAQRGKARDLQASP